MPNYKIVIQYDGTDFYGWQSQPNNNTIQDITTKAINQITRENINLIGSGRTDSGVHAIGQTANFKLSTDIDQFKFKHALNSVLPDTIAITDISNVDENFHSRFDAGRRSYIYLISSRKSPFYKKYSYQYPHYNKINLAHLKNLSESLIGKKDFTSFCKTKSDTENKVCNVNEINWRQIKEFLIFKIEADRFLHGMVRTIVGTLLYASINNKETTFLQDILKKKNREAAFQSVPAKGLFLYKVKY